MRTLGILVVLLAVLPDGFPTRLDELKLGGKSCMINISSLHQLSTYRAPERLRNPFRHHVFIVKNKTCYKFAYIQEMLIFFSTNTLHDRKTELQKIKRLFIFEYCTGTSLFWQLCECVYNLTPFIIILQTSKLNDLIALGIHYISGIPLLQAISLTCCFLFLECLLD